MKIAFFEILGTYCTFYNKVEILSNTYNIHFQLFTLATNTVSNTYNVLVMLVVRIFTNIDIVSNTGNVPACIDIVSVTYNK